MGRIAKFTSKQIEMIVEHGFAMGPNMAARELALHNIKITAGGVYYWMKKGVPKKVKAMPLKQEA